MYLVSTTFVVEPSAHAQWYEFFVEKFLPSIANLQPQFFRVLTNDNDCHYTYSLLLEAADIAQYQSIESQTIGECVGFCRKMFDDRVLHFTTLLKKIEQ